MTFWDQVKIAAVDGILVGVKILAVILVVLLGSGWILGDYAQVRSAALNSWSVIQRSQQAQQQSKPQPPQTSVK